MIFCVRLTGSDNIIANSVFLNRPDTSQFLAAAVASHSVWIYVLDILHTAYGPAVIITVACVAIKQVKYSESLFIVNILFWRLCICSSYYWYS